MRLSQRSKSDAPARAISTSIIGRRLLRVKSFRNFYTLRCNILRSLRRGRGVYGRLRLRVLLRVFCAQIRPVYFGCQITLEAHLTRVCTHGRGYSAALTRFRQRRNNVLIP